MTLAAALVDEERRLEEERIRALESLGVLGTGREERFDRITRLAQRLFGVPMAAVMLIDREHSWAKSSVGMGEDPAPAPRGDVFCNTTITAPTEPTVVEDLSHDDRFAANPFVTGEMGLRFYAGHALTAGAGHAVGTLCLFDQQPRHFSDTERAMLDELAEWAEAELNRSEEMERAAEMQKALLPRAETLRIGDYEVRGMCRPARSVGGDLVDYYEADGGDLVVTLGDVMGKGIGAALLMATVRSAVRTATRGRPPSEAIGEAARTLDDDLQGTGTLVTLCQARLTPETGKMSWSDAGHGLMVLVRADGTSIRPRAGGMPLGVLPDDEWPERAFVMEPGDSLVAFSDGLLDLFPTADATFADLVAALVADPGDVIGHVERLAGDGPLDDDVTAVVVRRCR
jgi:hypothetical protein